MANNVTHDGFIESDTLMSDSDQLISVSDSDQLISELINYPFDMSQIDFNSVSSPITPFSFSNLSTPSPSPTSPPADLSLVLPQVPNSVDQPNDILFSSDTNFNTLPLSETPAIFPVNRESELMDMELMMQPGVVFGPMTLQDIMQSEEYTCVRVFNGPNPRVTHIYDDYVLSSHPFDDEFKGTESFLKNCCMCMKALKEDIYIFRNMSFCSKECRYEEMWLDREEKLMKQAEEPSNDNPSQEVIFFIGDVPNSQSW